MALGSLTGVIPRLRNVTLAANGATTDAELLDRFVAERDANAFEVLVRRHGPMVFAVCRRVLRHTQDAEDAFQATFLVLAHKAATVSPRSRLAGWLHGVAHKTALKARHRAARRLEVEAKAPARSQEEMPPETNWDDAEPLLDQELAALPDRYRLPIILCDLEGRLRSEVAVTLGCSEGTLSSRLTRGRRLLANRLKHRGVHVTGAALTILLTERSVALAEPLIRSTVPAALSSVSGSAAGAGVASPSVALLATGVMKSMFLKKLQTVAVAAFVTALATFAVVGVVAIDTQAAPVPKTPATPALDEKALNESLNDVDGHLLLNRKVLKDIKCDIDQLDRIMDLLEAAEQQSQKKTNEAVIQLKVNPNGGNFNPEDFDKMYKEAQAAGEKEFRKAVTQVVTKELTLAQRKRLREIDLQTRGYEVFTTPSVVKALDLGAKQKEQFAANIKQVEEDVQQSFQKPQAANGVFEFNFDKVIQDARAEGLKRALAILTDEQKVVWKQMVGAPFTHPINRPWMPNGGGVGFGGGFQVAPAQGIQILPAVPAKPPVVDPGK